jgi:hypothetical protein
MLVGREHALGGVETNWGTPFEPSHLVFADHFWNTRFALVLFDSFEDDHDLDGVPDGWHLQGAMDYSVDGSESHGARYAGFPNAAVRVTRDTRSLNSDPVPVRPNTTYVLSAFLRGSSAVTGAPRLLVSWHNADGRYLGLSEADVDTIGLEYEKHEMSATSPPGAATASVLLDPAAVGVWYDVVRLKEETRFFGLIGPPALSPANVGEDYAAVFTAAGGVAPVAWSVNAGDLPAGLGLTADGRIEGVPSVPGPHTVTVVATDAAGRTDARSYRLDVLPDERGYGAVYLPAAQAGR